MGYILYSTEEAEIRLSLFIYLIVGAIPYWCHERLFAIVEVE